jgi:hypothetical protein
MTGDKTMRTNKIDIDFLMKIGILNLRAITENDEIIGVRGVSLSGGKRRKYLKAVKAAGIDTVIDLRTADHTDNFTSACEANELKCYHIPIDKKNTSPKEIIKNLPLLIDIMEQQNFYIACAQGLHRTDIALALNYLFNPKAQKPPIMYGHIKNGVFRYDDIFGRANSIFNNLTTNDKNSLGWDEAFEKNYSERKKLLTAMQGINL